MHDGSVHASGTDAGAAAAFFAASFASGTLMPAASIAASISPAEPLKFIIFSLLFLASCGASIMLRVGGGGGSIAGLSFPFDE